MSRDIPKMGAAEVAIRGIPFLYAAAITHELHCPRDAARHMNNGARRVATVKHSMPALHTKHSGRATYKKWDGATSTSAASHFHTMPRFMPDFTSRDLEPGGRDPGIPGSGSRDPDAGIQIRGAGS